MEPSTTRRAFIDQITAPETADEYFRRAQSVRSGHRRLAARGQDGARILVGGIIIAAVCLGLPWLMGALFTAIK